MIVHISEAMKSQAAPVQRPAQEQVFWVNEARPFELPG
jgi:hypothetical protein